MGVQLKHLIVVLGIFLILAFAIVWLPEYLDSCTYFDSWAIPEAEPPAKEAPAGTTGPVVVSPEKEPDGKITPKPEKPIDPEALVPPKEEEKP